MRQFYTRIWARAQISTQFGPKHFTSAGGGQYGVAVMGLGDEKSEFARRLKKLAQKERAMERGFTTQLRPDGLLIVKPRRRSIAISPRAVTLFLIAFFGFKGLAVAELGLGTYQAQVASLNDGTIVEQASAWVMQADPVTIYLAGHIRPHLN